MVRVAQQEIMGSGKQGLTHWCPTIAYLPQAPFHLKRLQSRLPRYLTHLYRSQPLNIIGVRHLNITGVHRHHTVSVVPQRELSYGKKCDDVNFVFSFRVRNERFN
ncbi:uncharacterized protein LOC135372181 isoform X2 [Ornithodoros turicata]|uniref:uncharacterized protein LOC135372181 isoform X2 n=1 Tax=Ornithodoros turicata TaxID=34597 RepID=UPI0031396874